MNSIDQAVFRNALGAFATGVTVVTARGPDGIDAGVTANSFNSVSLDPPLVLWSLNKSSSSLKTFVESEGFAIHILGMDQQALSGRFASKAEDRFAGLEFVRGFAGAPLLEGCAARFQCRLAFRYDGGDHEILVGEVVDLEHSQKAPLVYHGGRYAAVTGLVRAAAEEAQQSGGDELMHLLSRAYHGLFAAERRDFAQRNLTEESYLALRLLGHRDTQSFEQLARKEATAGRVLTREIMASLITRGEVARDEADVFSLTERGRQTMVELAAVRLALEEDVLASFDRSEVDILKSLLRRLVEENRPPQA